MYISDLENKKRLFFSLLASCGLILFLASLSVYMINGAEGLDSVVISACFLLTALSAIVILSRRVSIAEASRHYPKARKKRADHGPWLLDLRLFGGSDIHAACGCNSALAGFFPYSVRPDVPGLYGILRI